MTKPRLTKPGSTDLEWMHVVCTPEATHVEFHEDDVDAMDAARANLAPSCSTYVGRVTHQGEHRTRLDSKTVVLALRLDDVTYEAIRRAVAELELEDPATPTPPRLSRKGVAAFLRGHMNDYLGLLRDEYAKTSDPRPHSKFEPFRPWAKCDSVDECEAMGRCCGGCQGRL